MNILICGKNTPYTKNLADRLKREKNEIHYISGSKAAERMGNSVFQQFDFEYTNANIGRIVKSAKPDVAILLGATDRNYSWRDPIDDAMTFVSGMSSLLMAAKGAGVRKIVFVSSILVHEAACAADPDALPETIPPMIDAFVQAEHICKSVQDEHTEVVILRLPGETGYKEMNSPEDYCLLSAQKYLKGGEYPYSPEKRHAAMYYMDAVEAIIKVMNAEYDETKPVYQLQGVVFSEQTYADALKKTDFNSSFSPEVMEEPEAEHAADPVIDKSDDELLGFDVRFGIEEIAEKICKSCLSDKKKVEQDKGKKLHVLPLIEAVIAAVLVTFVTMYLRQTWVGDNFSFFIIYSLLFGAVYGTTYGLFAGVLSTIGMLVIQWQDAGLINTLENYVFFLCFLQYVLVGVIAGYMHDKFVRKTTTITEERNYLSQEVNDLTRINDNNIYVKNVYEKRLVGYENSLPRLFELTSQLDYMEPENIIFHATQVTKELLEVEDVAIYISSQKSSYYRLTAANSERAVSCGKSFKYDETAFLYDSFEQREIYKNRNMDDTRPSFAGAVMEGDRINAIIMVWTRDLHKINQYECDMLAIVCRLIEKSMSRATYYHDATKNENYIENTRILKEEILLQRFQIFEGGKRRGVFNYSILRTEADEKAMENAQRMTRDTDVLGVANHAIYILLPFSTEADAEFVIKRFSGEGMTVTAVESNELEDYIAMNDLGTETGAAEA